MMKYRFLLSLGLFLVVFCGNALADMEYEINFLLKAQNPPDGVVFEIVEGKQSDLDWALPKVQEYTKKLRQKYPKIKIAVVSHGTEQFGLLSENKKTMKEAHQRVQSLVSDDVPVNVCGTHASWYNKDDSDFPDYVSVVDAGPAKINEYQRMGYDLIVMEKPKP